jgi:UDP-4-amino-4,6-dideoxy-N-acetyl-beta-L-altrosamine transaminase
MGEAYKPSEFLSYGKQWIDDDDVAAVVKTLRGEYLTQGPAVAEFEKAIVDATGAKYCVAVANGTAALHVAVAALGIDGGSGITSPITFSASANCMAYNGLRPDFADIDPVTGCIDPDCVERRLKDDTKLLIPVHFAGQPAEMGRIGAIAKRRGLKVIEDAAHAIGSRYADGDRVGSCSRSDATIFSFHPVKTITTCEGGAVTTNDDKVYERLLLLRSHGITRDARFLEKNPGPWYYEMQALGFNYRLTDVQAVLGASQMRKLAAFADRRHAIVDRYNEGLAGIPWLACPPERRDVRSAFHLYVARFDFRKLGKSRVEVMATLKAKGIGTQVHYIPVHLMPFYRDTYGFRPGDFPLAEAFYESALSLPLYPKMSDADADYVIAAVRNLGS